MTDTTPTPRRLVANLSLSLDGRLNGPGGDYDMSWIVPHAITDGARNHMIEVTSAATTVILGRKNYEGFGSFWPAVADDTEADRRDRAFSRWLNEVDKVVVSSTLDQADWHNTRIEHRPPSEVVAELRQGRTGTDPGSGAEAGAGAAGDIIVLASGSVIKELLAADAVDRLSITLCPEIAGGGTRLFDDGLPLSSWSLTKSNPTASGALCLLYDRIR